MCEGAEIKHVMTGGIWASSCWLPLLILAIPLYCNCGNISQRIGKYSFGKVSSFLQLLFIYLLEGYYVY